MALLVLAMCFFFCEGGLHDTQGDSIEEENSMDDAGPEISSAEVRDEQLEAGYTPPNLNAHITGPFSEIKDIYKEGMNLSR